MRKLNDTDELILTSKIVLNIYYLKFCILSSKLCILIYLSFFHTCNYINYMLWDALVMQLSILCTIKINVFEILNTHIRTSKHTFVIIKFNKIEYEAHRVNKSIILNVFVCSFRKFKCCLLHWMPNLLLICIHQNSIPCFLYLLLAVDIWRTCYGCSIIFLDVKWGSLNSMCTYMHIFCFVRSMLAPTRICFLRLCRCYFYFPILDLL